MPLNKRIIAVKGIFNIRKEELKTILNETRKNEIILDSIFEKAFKYYMKHFNKERKSYLFC